MSRSFTLLISSGALLLVGMLFLTLIGGNRTTTSMPSRSPVADNLAVLGEVGAFSLTNQAGERVMREDLLGRPWAANLIFTRCPGPCTQMSGVMRSIQNAIPPGSSARLISLTSDPEYDLPSVLSAYASRHQADAARWSFLTGSKSEIRRLVTQGLLMVLQDKPENLRESEEDLFLHSTLIIGVDRKGRVRAAVEGLSSGASARVVEILRRLGEEE